MAVKIRLTRKGKKRQPSYRVVVADSRSPRDGRYIEQIGRYDPMPDPSEIVIDNERAAYWLSVGAEPTDAVRKLLQISGALAVQKAPQKKGSRIHVVGEEAQLRAAAEEAAAAAAAETAEDGVETEEAVAAGEAGDSEEAGSEEHAGEAGA
jgi:small subunit ribosomal protein S16